MATRAQAEHTSLKELLGTASGKVLDELGQDLTGLLQGSKLKDRDGRHQNTERVVNACQAKERVSKDRGRRFMMFANEEQRAAAALGSHDCCRNSLLVVRVGLCHLVLARVIRLTLLAGTSAERASMPKSFKLEPGSKKQSFQLELLYPEAVSMPVGEDGDGVDMLRFRTSGRMLPHCSAEKVVCKVPGTSLHPVKDTIYAVMDAESAMLFRMDKVAGGLKPWATLEHLTGHRELEPDLQLPDDTVCFNCHEGWSDESLGPLLLCKGGCRRAFHTGCHAHFPLDTQICGRCSGIDTDICSVCDHEWSDPSKDSDYYTGEMVGCDGPCGRWFHQTCHRPVISDAQVKSKKLWKCSDCAAGRLAPVPPPRPPPAASAGANSQAPTSTSSAPAATASSSSAGRSSACPLTMEAIEVVLTRGHAGYGFTISDDHEVEAVVEGGSAAVAGMQQHDKVVMANGRKLSEGEGLVLQGRQSEGVRLTLTCHRKRAQEPGVEAPPKRRRTTAQQSGMCSYAGVRMANAPRNHVQRMVDRFASGTADSL